MTVRRVDLNNPHWAALAAEHRKWLAPFDAQHLANWNGLLKTDMEAALCEAGVRRRLEGCGATVQPNESLSGQCGGPDFRCVTNETHFYVEVTCIRISTAEERTGIANEPRRKFAPYKVMGLTEIVFDECVNKAPQCANLDGPALVAIATLHSTAPMAGFNKALVSCVLTGKTSIGWQIDKTGQQVGETYQTTELQRAAFLRPDRSQGAGYARSSISGVLLLGLGTLPGPCLGVLHPNPARKFAPELLQGIEFGEVRIDPSSPELRVEWSSGKDH